MEEVSSGSSYSAILATPCPRFLVHEIVLTSVCQSFQISLPASSAHLILIFMFT